jgi:hypothetical protein
MTLLALLAWITTASAGLYLLSIWLIEYDKDFHAAAETRLPRPVLIAHVALAFGGLLVWAGYLVYDQDRLAWIALAAVVGAASLGTVMAIRWVGVYRAHKARADLAVVWQQGRIAVLDNSSPAGPPERSFPLSVVVAHGARATVTIVIVLLVTLGVGGS